MKDLKEFAEYYGRKAKEAREIARMLRDWIADPRLTLIKDGVRADAAEWDEVAERLELSASRYARWDAEKED